MRLLNGNERAAGADRTMQPSGRTGLSAFRRAPCSGTIALWLAALLLAASVADAQPTLPLERPVDRVPELPEPTGEPEDLIRVLPAIPPASEEELLAPGIQAAIPVHSLDLRGNTALSDAELETVAAPYLGQALDADALEGLRLALTRAYVAAGYVNSGAVIPEQETVDGRLMIEIVEGRVTEIRIRGLRYYRKGVIRKRLERGTSTPLDVNSIESVLRILDQDPRIRRVQARLAPGTKRAEAILDVMIEEELPYTLEFGFDNYETPTVGAYGGSLHAADRNLLGRGDRLGSDLSVTEGLVRVGGLYELPINSFGTSVFAEARYSHAELTENPFNKLDVKNDSYTFSLGVTQTVIHTPRDKVDLTLRAERRWSRSELLGRSFSFSDGSQNGRSEIIVLRAISEWSRREASTVMSARSTFSWGLDLLSPTVNSGSAPDGIFFSWLGQARFLHRFDPTGIEISFRGDIQLSDRPLLPLEQFTIGGVGNVRGYRKNQIVHDQGLIGSVDVRFPLWRTDTGRTILSIAPFADLGRTWNRDRVTHGKRTLSSLGAGLRYRPVPDWTFEVEWGGALRNTDTSGDLQDDGVIFRTTWRAL